MATNDDLGSSLLSPSSNIKKINALNTPPLGTPRRTTTPPPAIEKRRTDKKNNEENIARNSRATSSNSDAVDPNALSKALLKQFDDAGSRHRDITPGGSPSRKRQRLYGDR